jgi:enterochelin esterase-like enzyme
MTPSGIGKDMVPAEGRFHELGAFAIPDVAGRRRIRAYVHPRTPKRGPGRPLLIVFDGQNVFGDEGSFAGGHHLHRAIDAYAAKRARPPVVVAIDHGGTERIRELSPFRDPRHGGGNAPALLSWIAHQLVPQLRRHFDVATTAERTFLAGSSLGGLAALYGHFQFPKVFGGAIAMSPSLWFARNQMLQFVSASERPSTSRVYLDAGRREARGHTLRLATSLSATLARRGYGARDLKLRDDPRGGHNEKAWRRRWPAALRFMLA